MGVLGKKTIIFFPIEAGIAHITRSYVLAEELVKKGHKVIFALNKKKQHFIQNKAIKTVDVSEFFGDGQDIEKTKDSSFVYPFVLEELEILQKYNPDLAVIDFRLSAIVSCKKLGIPFTLITNTDGLPDNIYIPKLSILPSLQKMLDPLFQKLILRYKFQYFDALIKVAEKIGVSLTRKDFLNFKYLIPEIKEYLPAANHMQNIYHIGPVLWEGMKLKRPGWLNRIKPDGKTVYLTFGGTGYDAKKLIALSKRLVDKGFRVIVSTGHIADPKDFKEQENLYVEKFLPGIEVCKKVDLVVCHGGIGTLSQALVASKPVVVVPFNPDQYVHGFRFQELGMGICISNISIFQLLNINWDTFQNVGRNIAIDRIIQEVEQVLAQKKYLLKTIAEFRKKFIKADGCKNGVRLIESFLQ